MATANELKELTVEELERRGVELRDALFRDTLRLRTGALTNPSERTKRRRDLARILTVQSQKKQEGPKKSGKESKNG